MQAKAEIVNLSEVSRRLRDQASSPIDTSAALQKLLPRGGLSSGRPQNYKSDDDLQFWLRASKPKKMRERMLIAGVMPEHVDAWLSDFEVDYSACVDAGIGLVVYGTVGTGKTRLAAALVRCFLLLGLNARFVLARQLFREIRDTYRDESSQSETQVVDALCAHDVLVIDDLAREGGFRARQSSEHVLSVLHEVITRRNGHGHRTVVTTNLALDEIAEQYDEAIASRMSCWPAVMMAGKDRRGATCE